MATRKGICLVVSVKCTENGQWPHVILNPGATDVIAAGAGTAPRLNTARRDKGGVTHICRGAITGITSYEGSDKCRPGLASHKPKQSDNNNNNSNSSTKKRDKTGDTWSYCLIMDKH